MATVIHGFGPNGELSPGAELALAAYTPGGSAVGVPVFASEAEAIAYETDNPGSVALWFDGGTTTTTTTDSGGTTTTTTTEATTTTTTTTEATTTTTTTASSSVFVTDFSDDPVGALTGWTNQWDTGSTRTIVEVAGAIGGKVARFTSSNSVRKAVYWDTVPATDTVEVLVRHRCLSDTGNSIHIYALISGSASGDETALGGQRYSASQARIGGYLNGSLSLPAANNVSDPITLNQWMWTRFRIDSGTAYVKQWWDGISEPGSWDLTVAVPVGFPTSGRVGVGFNNYNYEVDYYAATIDGTTAPDPA